jgi:hypothetical protein
MLLGLSLSKVIAQSTYQVGFLPSINVNNKLKNDWAFNTKLESRLLTQRGTLNEKTDKKNQYVLTDLSFIAAKKIGLNSRLAGGYLLRLEAEEVRHRFMQQFTVVQRLSGIRWVHRFVFDQTFSKSDDPQYRIRYRISTEIPLNGESVDPGEFYVKINHEYLNSFQASEYDLEVRLIPLLGFDLTKGYKIETGMDYRANSFLKDPARHSYWMCFNFFIDL